MEAVVSTGTSPSRTGTAVITHVSASGAQGAQRARGEHCPARPGGRGCTRPRPCGSRPGRARGRASGSSPRVADCGRGARAAGRGPRVPPPRPETRWLGEKARGNGEEAEAGATHHEGLLATSRLAARCRRLGSPTPPPGPGRGVRTRGRPVGPAGFRAPGGCPQQPEPRATVDASWPRGGPASCPPDARGHGDAARCFFMRLGKEKVGDVPFFFQKKKKKPTSQGSTDTRLDCAGYSRDKSHEEGKSHCAGSRRNRADPAAVPP